MAEMTKDELQLATLIVDVLNLEGVVPAEINPEEPLFDGGLGLDSIDALEIAVAVSQNYDVHLKAEDEANREVFATLRNLSQHIGREAAG